VFILKMLPVRLAVVDWLTRRPVVESLVYPTPAGPLRAELYRPPTRGPHPGIVLSLGVLPRGVVDPRATMVAEAFARAGFATLLHWSPATRDLRLDPDDIPLLASAYEALTAHHDAWVSFVRDGDPGWPAFEPATRATMLFDREPTVVRDRRRWEMELWAGVR
jgi:hypothetical protein